MIISDIMSQTTSMGLQNNASILFLMETICKNNLEEKYFLEQNTKKDLLFTNVSEI